MKKGTLLIKVTGRDELYWVATFLAGYAAWQVSAAFLSERESGYAMAAVIVALIVAKFTVLRQWSIRTMDWRVEHKILYLDNQEIPLDSIDKVYFQRNKLSSTSWYLNARGMYRIHLESLSSPAAKREESIETLKQLAFALDPSLAGQPHLLPD